MSVFYLICLEVRSGRRLDRLPGGFIVLEHARFYLRTWDWRLFFFILLFLGLPNVYQIYRVYLIGNVVPDPGSLAIVSQWQFVGLVIEVFQEGSVLAIFFFIGSQLRSSAAIQLNRTKSVFTFIFFCVSPLLPGCILLTGCLHHGHRHLRRDSGPDARVSRHHHFQCSNYAALRCHSRPVRGP